MFLIKLSPNLPLANAEELLYFVIRKPIDVTLILENDESSRGWAICSRVIGKNSKLPLNNKKTEQNLESGLRKPHNHHKVKKFIR